MYRNRSLSLLPRGPASCPDPNARVGALVRPLPGDVRLAPYLPSTTANSTVSPRPYSQIETVFPA